VKKEKGGTTDCLLDFLFLKYIFNSLQKKEKRRKRRVKKLMAQNVVKNFLREGCGKGIRG